MQTLEPLRLHSSFVAQHSTHPKLIFSPNEGLILAFDSTRYWIAVWDLQHAQLLLEKEYYGLKDCAWQSDDTLIVYHQDRLSLLRISAPELKTICHLPAKTDPEIDQVQLHLSCGVITILSSGFLFRINSMNTISFLSLSQPDSVLSLGVIASDECETIGYRLSRSGSEPNKFGYHFDIFSTRLGQIASTNSIFDLSSGFIDRSPDCFVAVAYSSVQGLAQISWIKRNKFLRSITAQYIRDQHTAVIAQDGESIAICTGYEMSLHEDTRKLRHLTSDTPLLKLRYLSAQSFGIISGQAIDRDRIDEVILHSMKTFQVLGRCPGHYLGDGDLIFSPSGSLLASITTEGDGSEFNCDPGAVTITAIPS